MGHRAVNGTGVGMLGWAVAVALAVALVVGLGACAGDDADGRCRGTRCADPGSSRGFSGEGPSPADGGLGEAAAEDLATRARALCDSYLRCVGATTPAGLGAAAATYGPEGACWQALDPNACEKACRVGLQGLARVFPSEAACPLCFGDGDCAAEGGGVCDGNTGRCVECAGGRGCASGVCNEKTHTCAACVVDGDCPSATPFCQVGSGGAAARCVGCRTGAQCASGSCVDGACCQPETCGDVKRWLGWSSRAWVCGTFPSLKCSGASLDCGPCSRGACETKDAARACTLEDTPCTPGASGLCLGDETCTYVPSKGYLCAKDLRDTACSYTGPTHSCGDNRFVCDGANMVHDGVCRARCLAVSDCRAGERCDKSLRLGYGECR